MELVAIVEPSEGSYPGHMVIGQDGGGAVPRFFGFHFDPDTLPEEFRPPDRWQEFLYSNKILGDILDDTAYVQQLALRKPKGLCEKRTQCDEYLESALPLARQHVAYYSFRPDDFHSEAEPCYNCVTWATTIGNNLVSGFLAPVSQGRIKLILRQLRADARNTGESNG